MKFSYVSEYIVISLSTNTVTIRIRYIGIGIDSGDTSTLTSMKARLLVNLLINAHYFVYSVSDCNDASL